MSPPRAGRLKRDRLDYGRGGASQWPPPPQRLLKATCYAVETSEVCVNDNCPCRPHSPSSPRFREILSAILPRFTIIFSIRSCKKNRVKNTNLPSFWWFLWIILNIFNLVSLLIQKLDKDSIKIFIIKLWFTYFLLSRIFFNLFGTVSIGHGMIGSLLSTMIVHWVTINVKKTKYNNFINFICKNLI